MHNKLELELDSDSIFYKLGSSGLITFSDYIFLLTVLSSEYNFSSLFTNYHVHYRCLCVVKKLISLCFIGINGLYNIICELR